MGISQTTSPFHMVRSIYEGVAFGLYEVKQVYDELKIPFTTLTLLGGGVKSTFWLEMIASVFGMPVSVHPHYQSGTSLGAALCAMVAYGTYPTLEDAIASIPFTPKVIQPDMHKHAIYMQYYPLYTQMYQSMKALYAELHRLTTSFEEVHV